MKDYTVLHKIEDVLQIPNLCDKYRYQAIKLANKIQWLESKQVINGVPYILLPAYSDALLEAGKLMKDIANKADYIVY